MTEARLILICGLPGSGKTTLAKQPAPEVLAVRLCPDEWKYDLGIDYDDEQRRIRLEQRLWRLGQELLGLGQSVILETAFGSARNGTNSGYVRELLAWRWNCTTWKRQSMSFGDAWGVATN